MRFILPGMGATNAMYDGAWRSLPDTLYPNWPAMSGDITLEKVAETVIYENGITNSDQIGGSSLGGIIAIEIAKILKSELVILIGSAISPEDINPLLLKLSPLSSVTPVKLI